MLPNFASFGGHMQIRVELAGIEPAIWRRLIVPAEVTLDVLHAILQISFGWTDSHLHDFQVGQVRLGMVGVEDETLLVDERAAPLGAVADQGSTLVYRYDFGDDWDHLIEVESVLPYEGGSLQVTCLDGARACPPEDCGGPLGYENLLRVLGDRSDEEYESMRTWVGRGFDAEKFDKVKVNKKLVAIARMVARTTSAAARSRRRM